MNTQQITLPNGYILKAREISDFIINEIWYEKIYEKDFTINENMTIVDIGANQGIFSLYAASKKARVFSIEPEQINFDILNENIALNNLQERIQTYNVAISKQEGYIDFFMPSVDNKAYSGMNSTNFDFTDNLQSLNDFTIDRKLVKALTLDGIIDQIRSERIDLLKIDCEGAELDIIESGSPETFAKVDNIVMELHRGYSQKDLFYKIKNAGFTIVNYEKLSGLFEGGYLFATRTPKEDGYIKPVSLFSLPPVMSITDAALLDASQCFSTQSAGRPLNYVWSINNETMYTGTNKIINHTFEKTGYYTIVLDVIDDELIDRKERSVYVVDDDYYHNTVDFTLSEMDNYQTFTLKAGKNYFKIPSESLQKEWKPIYKLSIEEPDTTNPTISGDFYFNGNKIALKEHYNDFFFDNIPRGFDIIFYFDLPEERELEIGWCIK